MPGMAVDDWVTAAPLTEVSARPPTPDSRSVRVPAVASRCALAAPIVPSR